MSLLADLRTLQASTRFVLLGLSYDGFVFLLPCMKRNDGIDMTPCADTSSSLRDGFWQLENTTRRKTPFGPLPGSTVKIISTRCPSRKWNKLTPRQGERAYKRGVIRNNYNFWVYHWICSSLYFFLILSSGARNRVQKCWDGHLGSIQLKNDAHVYAQQRHFPVSAPIKSGEIVHVRIWPQIHTINSARLN